MEEVRDESLAMEKARGERECVRKGRGGRDKKVKVFRPDPSPR